MLNMANKWDKLIHNGPIFPALYESTKLSVKINGKDYQLPLDAEEMIYAWAQKHATPYVQDKVFQTNFWKDLKGKLPEELQNTTFPSDWNLSSFIALIESKKEIKKNKSKEERQAEKNDREEKRATYGHAVLNGTTVELGNYLVEPPGIYMGRGQHPLRGRWKPRVFPEDVSINLSRGQQAPVPPAGHAWKAIIENRKALWTSMWFEKLTGAQKRVLFSVNSFIRQDADQKKFTKAIQLANNFKKVNDYIEKNLTSQNRNTREVATISYLISKLSIRVGDEKGEDTADTVGATSLRVEHVTINGLKITFDFLGKDSIRYKKTTEDLDINAIRNLKEFMNGKKKGDMIFSDLSSKDVNEFLANILPGLTAKQFRTATGSTLLASFLKSEELDLNMKMGKKLEFFTEANLEIAVKLNHQSAVSASYEQSLDNMKERITEVKDALKTAQDEANAELNQAKMDRDNRVGYANARWSGAKKNEAVRRANETYKTKKERIENRITRLKERLDNIKTKASIKEKTKGVALGTSKLNYADPRIPISWCKANGVDIGRIYPATAQKKFAWAFSASPDFYKKYPVV